MAIATDVYFITNVEYSKPLTLKYPDKTRTDVVISGDEMDSKVRCVLIGAHSCALEDLADYFPSGRYPGPECSISFRSMRILHTTAGAKLCQKMARGSNA